MIRENGRQNDSLREFFVQEGAVVDDGVMIGARTKVWHFTHIQKDAQIGTDCVLGQNVNIGGGVKVGNNCKIQNNVSIYEGVELEDNVFCGPSMVFTNVKDPRCKYPQASSEFFKRTLVKNGASIGANATIICGVTIGRDAFIGAGAVVTKDVADFALVLGNPGKQVGWVSEGCVKLDFHNSNIVYCEKSEKWYQLKNNYVTEHEEEPSNVHK